MSNDRTPPAEGTIILDAAFDLPQGKAQALDRLALRGSITAERLKFTNPARAREGRRSAAGPQGRPGDQSIDEVASRVTSKFNLNRGVLTYDGLSFDVEGASVKLNGSHALKSRTLDLNGEVLLPLRLRTPSPESQGGCCGQSIRCFGRTVPARAS